MGTNYAWGICDRCGMDFRYDELRSETVRGIEQNNAVCWSCFDEDHPQLWVGEDAVVDQEFLEDPRPEINLSEFRSLFGFQPVGAPGDRLVLSFGKVSVLV